MPTPRSSGPRPSSPTCSRRRRSDVAPRLPRTRVHARPRDRRDGAVRLRTVGERRNRQRHRRTATRGGTGQITVDAAWRERQQPARYGAARQHAARRPLDDAGHGAGRRERSLPALRSRAAATLHGAHPAARLARAGGAGAHLREHGRRRVDLRREHPRSDRALPGGRHRGVHAHERRGHPALDGLSRREDRPQGRLRSIVKGEQQNNKNNGWARISP
jgi:hypothetical protein